MITWNYVKKVDQPETVNSFLKEHHVQPPESLVALIIENNDGSSSDITIITSSIKNMSLSRCFHTTNLI